MKQCQIPRQWLSCSRLCHKQTTRRFYSRHVDD